MDDGQAGNSAIRKLDAWFAELGPEEQAVIGGMVHASIMYAAAAAAGADPAAGVEALPPYIQGMTEQNAPNLAAAFSAEVGGYGGQFNGGFGGGGGQFNSGFGTGGFGGQFGGGGFGGQFNGGGFGQGTPGGKGFGGFGYGGGFDFADEA